MEIWIPASKLFLHGIVILEFKSYMRTKYPAYKQYNKYIAVCKTRLSSGHVHGYVCPLRLFQRLPHTQAKGVLAGKSLWPSISQNVWSGLISRSTRTAPASHMRSPACPTTWGDAAQHLKPHQNIP